jgi:hypothetical protein
MAPLTARPWPSDLKPAILFLLLFRSAFFLRRLCGLLLRFLLPVHTLTHGISPFDDIFSPWHHDTPFSTNAYRGVSRWVCSAGQPSLGRGLHCNEAGFFTSK